MASLFAAAASCAIGAVRWATLDGAPPRIIGHRGDPYFATPHTLASYSVAISEGDGYIEPDLAMTRDGVVVVAHDPYLNNNTDVADLFPGRDHDVYIDHAKGWKHATFVMDLTLAEVRRLRVVQDQKDPSKRDPFFNGYFGMPTFSEAIAFVQNRSRLLGRPISIVPELKHVQLYARSGNPLLSGTAFPDAVLRILREAGYNDDGKGPHGDVMVQCFDSQPLQYLRSQTSLPTVMLVNKCSDPETVAPKVGDPDWRAYFRIKDIHTDARALFQDWYLTAGGMREAAAFATSLSPWKGFFLPPGPNASCTLGGYDRSGGCLSRAGFNTSDPSLHREVASLGGLLPFRDLVPAAHRAGMAATVWVFRNPLEDDAVGELYAGDVWCELQDFMDRGTDYLFCEKSMDALAVRKLLQRGGRASWCAPPPA